MKYPHWFIKQKSQFIAWKNKMHTRLQWETDKKRRSVNSYYLTDILDRALSNIWPGGIENEKQLFDRVFPFTVEIEYLHNQLSTVVKALTDDGLIYYDKGLFHITYKGNMMIEDTLNTPYFKRPFRLAQVRKKMKSFWLFIKIVAGFLNALAIIYLGWLQVKKDKPVERPLVIQQIATPVHTDKVKVIKDSLNYTPTKKN